MLFAFAKKKNTKTFLLMQTAAKGQLLHSLKTRFLEIFF
jgi:hypothetical protein